MNTFGDCEICGNVTASVTVRTSDSTIRVCSGCYTRHYDANAESAVAWEAEFDEIDPTCEGCGEEASIEQRDEDAGVSAWWCSECWAEAMSHAD